MKILIACLGFELRQVELIEHLLEFEGYSFERILPSHPLFKEYYKGNNPVIILLSPGEKDVILYGFWQVAEYFLKNGIIRC